MAYPTFNHQLWRVVRILPALSLHKGIHVFFQGSQMTWNLPILHRNHMNLVKKQFNFSVSTTVLSLIIIQDATMQFFAKNTHTHPKVFECNLQVVQPWHDEQICRARGISSNVWICLLQICIKFFQSCH